MSKIIVLRCKNCGARLEIAEERDIFYCEHCGYKHILDKVRSNIVNENYASCPLCKRNDKAKKITSYGDLYQKPQKPIKEPDVFKEPYAKKKFIWPIILIIYSIFSFFNWGYESRFYTNTWILLVQGLIALILGLVSLKARLDENKKNKQNNIQAKIDWEYNKKRYDLITPIFNKILELWEELYYCERDDIVYLRGYREYTTKENIYDYIEKQALRKDS
jgi:DNA-directed RNA polymerase subunit RPC12/RpoP